VAQTPEEVAARQAIEAQLLARDDRILTAQRAVVDNAKLVSTFVLTLAATLLGTALQVTPRAGAELTALISTAGSLFCVLVLISLDSIDIPTFDQVPDGLSGEQRQQVMRIVVDLTIKSNEKTASWVRGFALVSVAMSAFAGVVSAASLMAK
jgi:hypothetical protein